MLVLAMAAADDADVIAISAAICAAIAASMEILSVTRIISFETTSSM